MHRIDKLENEIESLINMYNNCSNSKERTKIHFTLLMLLEVFNETSSIYSSGYEKYKKNSYDVEEYMRKTLLKILSQTYDENYQNMIFQIITNCETHFENYTRYNLIQYNTFTIQEAKQLIINFFSELDKNLIPIIEKALNDEHLFIKTEPRYGYPIKSRTGFTTYNMYTKSPFTFIDNCGRYINIDTIATIVHELGHIINFNINYKFSKTNLSNFIEVPGCTFSYLFLKYLIRQNIFSEDTQRQINYELYLTNINIENLKKLNSKRISLENLSYSNRCNLENDPYKYSFGHLLSIYYSKLYEQDKEKTIYNLYNLIKNIGIKDDMYMLNHFGIDKDEFINCDYLKDEININQYALQTLNKDEEKKLFIKI